MDEDRDTTMEDRRTSVERLLTKDLDERDGFGRPLSDRARHAQRSVEAYLQASGRPRWMERVMEIDRRIESETRRLEEVYRALARQCGRDATLFARRWRELAHSCAFDQDLNELIAVHNEWYPIERDLPMDPRTRDYVRINGRSYRRPLLGPDWLLERFPPALPHES